ncbi:hypothetical protein AB4342_01275 [Vibrio breoganii]
MNKSYTVLVEDHDGKRYGSRNFSKSEADRIEREAKGAIKQGITDCRINFTTLDGLSSYMKLKKPVAVHTEG